MPTDRLIDFLYNSGEMKNLLYYKSDTEAVIRKWNPETGVFDEFKIAITDFKTTKEFNANRIKHLVIDKVRDFGFLEQYKCTAMSLGHIALFSFLDTNATIRMEVVKVNEYQIRITNAEFKPSRCTDDPNIQLLGQAIWDGFMCDCRFKIKFYDPYDNDAKCTFFLYTKKEYTDVEDVYRIILYRTR